MSYLQQIKQRIDRDDFEGFLHLWEEYCQADEIDPAELQGILQAIHNSRFALRFGRHAESALTLWKMVSDADRSYAVLRTIIDLQTTNSAEVAEVAYRVLEERFGDQPYFAEKIRLVGLRNREKFQGAISNYELLTHLDRGRFVFHTGGWGTGEIVDLSLVREELVIEFECVAGRKTVSFENCFGTLIPLDDGHFLSRRFGDPDALEEQARQDPVGVIRMLLKDLGPKLAAEIKEELCDLVIPAKDWTKWWQAARTRLKKDTMIEMPSSIREPFRLRAEELSHAERLQTLVRTQRDPDEVLLTVYNFIRDFPEIQRSQESRSFVRSRLKELFDQSDLSHSQRLSTIALLEEVGEGGEREEELPTVKEAVGELSSLVKAIEQIDIGAVKKRVLVAVREVRSDWVDLFLSLLRVVPQAAFRDYLLRELLLPEALPKLKALLEELIEHPMQHPHLAVWYFQKVIASEEESVPFSDEASRYHLFESFLTLMHRLEREGIHRDLIKKMYSLLVADRYAHVRHILSKSSEEFAREFLLLVTKCQTLTDHDIQIMHSLVDVVHPHLKGSEEVAEEEELVVWTTEEGYRKVRDRIEQIGTVEMIENAREIEAARALGDLRENAEYKFAQERRRQLQSELKRLSDQLNGARILSPDDVTRAKVGVGTVVELENSQGKRTEYTLLGPWDADADNLIVSYQSQIAKAMTGREAGESFEYKGETYTIRSIQSFFEVRARS